jgi:hypothetical protein
MKVIKIITSLLLAIFAGAIFSVATGADAGISVACFTAINVGVNGIAYFTGWSVPGLAVDYASLIWADGQDNIPGIRTVGYYALKSWISNFPEATAEDDAATFADLAKLESDVGFTFNAGYGWMYVYGTEGKNKVDFEGQGERDCKSFKNTYTFVYPGTDAEAKAFCRKMNNSDSVFMATEFDGTNVVIGHPRINTVFSVTGTTGDERTSQKGCTVTVECTHELPAPIYEGDITLHPNASS